MTKRRTTASDFDDFAPATSGRGSLGDALVPDADFIADDGAPSLDTHLLHLMKLHPDVGIKFSKQDLSELDDIAKREILEDLNELLGIGG